MKLSHPLVYLGLHGVVSLLGVVCAEAQELASHFLLMNEDTQEVVQRGATAGSSVALDQLIVAPNTDYRLWILRSDGLTGSVAVKSLSAGSTVTVPPIDMGSAIGVDLDGDGLGADAEFILGTSASNKDTDEDGVSDRAELEAGTNPLDGIPARTGIVGSTDTPGNAVDVSAFNDLIAVADSNGGLQLFNIFNGMDPAIVGQVAMPGSARAVAMASGHAAVSVDSAGLVIVEIREPAQSRIIHTIPLGSNVLSVATFGGLCIAGLENGRLALVELASGTVIDRITAANQPIRDVGFGINHIYAVTDSELVTLRYPAGVLEVVGQVGLSGSPPAGRRRLFVGDQVAFVSMGEGFQRFSLADPSAPQSVSIFTPTNNAARQWQQVVANGSNLAVSIGNGFSPDRSIELYRLPPEPSQEPDFLASLGSATNAQALTIFNGLAYIANGPDGLQLVNYLAYDAAGQPPIAQLEVFPSSVIVEEGSLVTVNAQTSDDVQVRNVEFYLDGERIATDGNFPFRHQFQAPLLSEQPTFTVQARVSDTGGNATLTPEFIITIAEDATAPMIGSVTPRPNALVGSIPSVSIIFNEQMNVASLADGISLIFAGADEAPGTADDEVVATTLDYQEAILTAFLQFDDLLTPGIYTLSIGPPVSDAANNLLSNTLTTRFRVFSFADRDGDELPDDFEVLLGLDPDFPDTDGNGVPDGQEDFDNDGAPNGAEVLAGFDPTNPDTDGNGILDGLEDPDMDGLTTIEEIPLGTDAAKADSDDDGWNDAVEVEVASNPLDAASMPNLFLHASQQIIISQPLIRTRQVINVSRGGNSAVRSNSVRVRHQE